MGRARRTNTEGVHFLDNLDRIAETKWFHGSADLIEEVNIMRSSGDRILGPGFYCTDSREAASTFGSRLHRVTVNPSRVLDLQDPASRDLLDVFGRLAQELETKWQEPERERKENIRWRLVPPEGSLVDIVDRLRRQGGSNEDVFIDFRRALYFRSLDNKDEEAPLRSLHKHLALFWDAILMEGVPGKQEEKCSTLVVLSSGSIKTCEAIP